MVFPLIFSIFLMPISLFWKVLYSFWDAQFFARSSYGPKSSSTKKYEVSVFKRTVERSSTVGCNFVGSTFEKLVILSCRNGSVCYRDEINCAKVI